MPNGKLIALKFDFSSNRWAIFDVQTGKEMYKVAPSIDYMQVSHDGRLMAAHSSRKVDIIDIQSGKILRDLIISKNIAPLAFSPDDKMLVAGCDDGEVIVWLATRPEKKQVKRVK